MSWGDSAVQYTGEECPGVVPGAGGGGYTGVFWVDGRPTRLVGGFKLSQLGEKEKHGLVTH